MTKKEKSIWEPEPDLRFRTTEYVVDATHSESHELWYKYHMIMGVKFEQDSMGMWREIGMVDGRPICVSVFWFIIEDLFRVAFVEGTSQLVDYEMVDRWQRQAFYCLRQPNRMYRRHSDVANFGHVISDIGRRLGKDVVRRDIFEVERILKERMPLREDAKT